MTILHNRVTGHFEVNNDQEWVIALGDSIQVGWVEGDHLVLVDVHKRQFQPFTVDNR